MPKILLTCRIDAADRDRIQRLARSRGQSPSQLIRQCIGLLSLAKGATEKDLQKPVRQVAKILGLDPDAEPRDVLAALTALVDDLLAVPAEALGESADPQAPPVGADRKALTRLSKCDTVLGAGADGSLPREFRIFRSGFNQSTKGEAVFDRQAAADVMRQYQLEGNDLIVDRQHDSLNPEALALRSDAADAMAHFKLAVRDGELWAVDVRWTPEGEDRLRAKKQRYISPAFMLDKATRRICSLTNCALVSIPATHNATELVAAGKAVTKPAAPALSPDEAQACTGMTPNERARFAKIRADRKANETALANARTAERKRIAVNETKRRMAP